MRSLGFSYDFISEETDPDLPIIDAYLERDLVIQVLQDHFNFLTFDEKHLSPKFKYDLQIETEWIEAMKKYYEIQVMKA